MSKNEMLKRRGDIQLELNKLYESELAWRSICHQGVRGTTKRRVGKLQKARNEVLTKINKLKIERVELEYNIRRCKDEHK